MGWRGLAAEDHPLCPIQAEAGRYLLRYNPGHPDACLRHMPKTPASGATVAFFPNGALPSREDCPWAIKFFPSRSEREESYERQHLAYEHGLACPVGGIITLDEMTPYHHNKWYGYETRMALVSGMPGFPLLHLFEAAINSLYHSLAKLFPGGQDCDLHGDNYGFWKEQLVCIDFNGWD